MDGERGSGKCMLSAGLDENNEKEDDILENQIDVFNDW